MPQNDLSRGRSRLPKKISTPGSQRVTDDNDHDSESLNDWKQ